MSYTLDPAARKLITSSNQTLVLSESQTNEMVNAFQEIALADQLTAEVENAPLPPLPPTCAGGGSCDEIRDESAPRVSAEPRADPPYRGLTGRRALVRRGDVRRPSRAGNHGSRVPVSDFTEAFSIPSGGPCYNIAESIFAATIAYRGAKDNYMTTLKQIRENAVYGLVNGVFEAVLGGGAQGQVIEYLLGDLSQKRAVIGLLNFELNVLAVMYSQNQCWSLAWEGSPSAPPAGGFPAPPRGMQWRCEYEWGWISLDGGSSWTGIQVRVCWWVPATM
jgi:hypothetical protein